jgi:hypothetical protein
VRLRLGLSALSIDRAKIEGPGKLLNYLGELSPTRLEGADESSAMEYKQFIIELFERELGKWRATVRRSDGKPLIVSGRGRAKLREFVTGIDAMTAEAALLAAVAAIDAGAFSRKRAVFTPTGIAGYYVARPQGEP